jgi:hypothetical protein
MALNSVSFVPSFIKIGQVFKNVLFKEPRNMSPVRPASGDLSEFN